MPLPIPPRPPRRGTVYNGPVSIPGSINLFPTPPSRGNVSRPAASGPTSNNTPPASPEPAPQFTGQADSAAVANADARGIPYSALLSRAQLRQLRGTNGRNIGQAFNRFVESQNQVRSQGPNPLQVEARNVIYQAIRKGAQAPRYNKYLPPIPGGVSEEVRMQRLQQLRTKVTRGLGLSPEERRKRNLLLTNAEVIEKYQLESVEVLFSALRGFPALLEVIQNPLILRNLPKAIAQQGKDFGQIVQEDPSRALAIISTNIALDKGLGKALDFTAEAGTTLLGKTIYKEPKANALGIKTIKNVNRVGDIDIIPEGRKIKLSVDPIGAVAQAKIRPLYKDTIILPRASNIEKRILRVVRDQGDVIGGSYAQEAVLKSKFTRPHKDIDILSKDRGNLINALKKEFGNQISIRPKARSIQVFHRGRQVADIVNYEIGEAGYIKKFGTVKHSSGLQLARPEARLAGKVSQLGAGKGTSKVIKDIEAIYGKKANLRSASTRGGFGFSKSEQARYIGKKGPLTTAQNDLLGKGIFKSRQMQLKRFLYVSPFNIETGAAQVRVSRLGISKPGSARLLDLLSGDISFSKPKPQIFILPEERIFAKPRSLRSKNAFIETKKGFVIPQFSSELEAILGKGYVIRRGKTLTRVNIEGKLVPVIELKKARISPAIESLIEERKSLVRALKPGERYFDSNKKIMNRLQETTKKIKRQLKSDTGLNYISRSPKEIRYISPKRLGLRASRFLPRYSPSKSYKSSLASYQKRSLSLSTTRFSSSRSYSQASRSASSPVSSSKSGITRSPPPYSPGRYQAAPRYSNRLPPRYPIPYSGSGRGPAPKPRYESKEVKQRMAKEGKQLGFNVYAKSGNRYVKINRGPLNKVDALSRGAFAVDNTTSRRFAIRPVGFVPKQYFGRINRIEKGYFAKKRQKYRGYQIQRGRKKIIINNYIERTKYAIDTRTEKKQLSLARLLRARGYLRPKVLNKRGQFTRNGRRGFRRR